MFKKGRIEGVEIRALKKYVDERGWLSELFRSDDVSAAFMPVMAYFSLSRPGVTRGPHEHVNQADYFCFIGPSNFKLTLWDHRTQSPTFRHKMQWVVGEDAPTSVIVPVGVVHAYQNVGGKDGVVINCPNRLFMGENRRDSIDEIRHEADMQSPFVLDLHAFDSSS